MLCTGPRTCTDLVVGHQEGDKAPERVAVLEQSKLPRGNALERRIAEWSGHLDLLALDE